LFFWVEICQKFADKIYTESFRPKWSFVKSIPGGLDEALASLLVVGLLLQQDNHFVKLKKIITADGTKSRIINACPLKQGRRLPPTSGVLLFAFVMRKRKGNQSIGVNNLKKNCT
jgi:hypothetical protein